MAMGSEAQFKVKMDQVEGPQYMLQSHQNGTLILLFSIANFICLVQY